MRRSSCRFGAIFLTHYHCGNGKGNSRVFYRAQLSPSRSKTFRFFASTNSTLSTLFIHHANVRFQSGGGVQTRSRFTRQGTPSSPNNSRSPSNGAILQGPEKYGVNPTGCSGQQFLTLLHRLRAEYKQQPNENRRLHTLYLLSHFSLKRVANMDGRIVHQLLELLARLQASPVDSMLVQEAVAWLTLYGSSPSTSAMLVTQCLRNLLLLDVRELIMPVLLGCQSTFAMLESQQRATDACVVLLAAVLHGLTYHDRRSTTSHQQLLPVMERLMNQVISSSLEHASNTDLRLLLEVFGAACREAPELFQKQENDKQHVSDKLVECVCYLRSVLAQERGEEVSGSLLLHEALQLLQCCETLFPVASIVQKEIGASSSASIVELDEDEKVIKSLVFRRVIELMDNQSAEETISSSVVLGLQDFVLRHRSAAALPPADDVHLTPPNTDASSEMHLINLGSACIKQYFSEDGEASPDVAIQILRMYSDHQQKAKSTAMSAQEHSPTDSLSLLVAPPTSPPTGCVAFHDERHASHAESGKNVNNKQQNTLVVEDVPEYILRNIENTWQKCIPATLPSENGQSNMLPLLWSSSSIESLVRYFESCEVNKAVDGTPRSCHLRQYYFTRLQSTFHTTPARLVPSDFAPFFVENASRESYFPEVVTMVTSCMANWSVNQVLHWLRISAGVPCNTAIRLMMREGCKSLVPYMDRASSEQLVALMYYYGRAGVRQDEFCEAVAKRLGKLCEEIVGRTPDELNGSLLSLVGLSIILSSFAAVEYRSTKPFLDASPVITQALLQYTQNASNGNVEDSASPSSSLLASPSSLFALSPKSMAETGTVLLAAYAKMLVWHFKAIWSLAEFLSSLSEFMTLRQLLVAQLALQRMDVQHPALIAAFQSRLRRWAETTSHHPTEVFHNSDVVILLSVWSRVSSAMTAPIAAVVDGKTTSAAEDAVIRKVFYSLVRERLTSFTPLESAEILLSLARMGMGDVMDSGEEEGDTASSPPSVFDQLTTQLIHTLPTATPQALCHMVNAYALARRSHPELFSLVSQRVIRTKNDIPAVMIASILSAFADTGNDDAVLFMEMIPRVRFVAQFGTPRDVTNVVWAYATVKVWHYKLFSRLADRAIQLRGEFSPVHLVRLLQAYGMVGMRYDSLFTEMSSRIQAVVHLMTPRELGLLLESYAAVHMHAPPVFESCANHALTIVDSFSLEDAELVLSSLETVGHLHPALWLAFHNRFPEDLRDKYLGVQQRQQANPQSPSVESEERSGNANSAHVDETK